MTRHEMLAVVVVGADGREVFMHVEPREVVRFLREAEVRVEKVESRTVVLRAGADQWLYYALA